MSDIYIAWEEIKLRFKETCGLRDKSYNYLIDPLTIGDGHAEKIEVDLVFDEPGGIEFYTKYIKKPLELISQEVTGHHYDISFVISPYIESAKFLILSYGDLIELIEDLNSLGSCMSL